MLAPYLAEFLDANIVGVLATERPDGRPRQSLVYYARDGERVLVTTDAARQKVADVRRNAWASLCVMAHDRPFPSATFAGPARILTQDIGVATAAVIQRVADLDEPPEPQSDEALAGVGRVILAIEIERVGPVTYVEGG